MENVLESISLKDSIFVQELPYTFALRSATEPSEIVKNKVSEIFHEKTDNRLVRYDNAENMYIIYYREQDPNRYLPFIPFNGGQINGWEYNTKNVEHRILTFTGVTSTMHIPNAIFSKRFNGGTWAGIYNTLQITYEYLSAQNLYLVFKKPDADETWYLSLPNVGRPNTILMPLSGTNAEKLSRCNEWILGFYGNSGINKFDFYNLVLINK